MRNPNQIEAAGERYRPDIDGLRAVAIIPVVFFHFRLPGFDGGFVGVDVFFVISGYLITTLIHAEMQNDRFSLASFYERRVRRIFPALFAVLGAVAALSCLLLLPGDLARFGKSLIATTLFSSNFLFWQEGGYFDAVSTTKPLLHTWSLAVEEQFYLVYPTLLFAIHRSGRPRLLWCVEFLLLASFGMSVAGVRFSPLATFYLLPGRMWELMLGAVVALRHVPVPQARLLREILGVAGLGMIGLAVVFFHDGMLFPGTSALLPCVGAALVIYAGSRGQTLVRDTLGLRIPVLVGLVSYSLYLWHWPLYVLGNYYAIDGLTSIEKAGLIVLSFLLAWGSYRYVERPFRGKFGILTRKVLFEVALIATALFVFAGATLAAGTGLPSRQDAPVQALLANPFDRNQWRQRCFNPGPDRINAGALCRIGDAHAPVSFLLWGDSHADALSPAVSSAASALSAAGLFVAQAACPPLIGVERSDSGNMDCRTFNDAVANLLRRRSDIRLVILAARWSRTALATPYGHEEGNLAWLSDGSSATQSFEENKSVFRRGLDRTLGLLKQQNKEIVVVGPVPEVGWNVPDTLAKLGILHSTFDIRPKIAQFESRQAYFRQTIESLRKKYALTSVWPSSILCGRTNCEVQRGGNPYYGDAHHLSVFGAEQLTPLFKPLFAHGRRAATSSGLAAVIAEPRASSPNSSPPAH